MVENKTMPASALPVQHGGGNRRGGELFRLTCLQERIWLQEQVSPGSASHNAPIALHIRGPLDTGRLERALNVAITDNEALRACFAEIDGSVYQYAASHASLALAVEDLSSRKPKERIRALYLAIGEEVAKPFDLTRGPLLRAALFRLRPEESVLLLVLHHIVSDGWSQEILLGEVAAAYAGDGGGRPAARKESFFRYAATHRAELEMEDRAGSKTYWNGFIAGVECVTIPYDRMRGATLRSIGKKKFFTLDPALASAVRQLCTEAGVTPFVVFLAILGLVAKRRAAVSDWCMPVAVGYREDARWFDVIGCFVDHILVKPVADPRDSFRRYVQAVSSCWQQAFAHRDYPMERFLQDAAGRNGAIAPSLVYVYQNGGPTPSIAGLDIAPLALHDAAAKFDITAMVAEQADTFSLSFEYDSTLYDEETVSSLGDDFLAIATMLHEDAGRAVSEVEHLLDERCGLSFLEGPRSLWPNASFREIFEATATRCWRDEALRDGGRSLTYGALYRDVEALAARLRGCGRSGMRVGVHLERSPELVVSLLAILIEGHCYVPLPVGHPDRRLAYLIDDSLPSLILSDDRGSERIRGLRPGCTVWAVGEGPAQAAPPPVARPEGTPPNAWDATYLIYTSGSTGQPKGAFGLVEGLLNRLRWQWCDRPYETGDRALLRTSPAFVDSIFEILAPVLGGICSVIAHDEDVQDVASLCRLIARHGITHVTAVPSYLGLMLDVIGNGGVTLPGLKVVHCSGERLPKALARTFAEVLPHAVLVNIYGATEVTADVTCQVVGDGAGAFGIGMPIPNAAVAVIDERGNVLPRGVWGEIAVFGAPVGGGYHNDPALTADRFWPDSRWAPGRRMFRTGDVGRINTDGTCEYLGRRDLQVKLRGMRASVIEIEEALRECSSIAGIVVMPEEGDGSRLVAYYMAADAEASKERLADHAATVLPAHAVPSRWVKVRNIPHTDSGKPLRRREALEAHRDPEDDRSPAAASALERRVLEIWTTVLGHASIGLDDHFMRVGGHSLLAVRLLDTLNKQLGISIRLPDFFADPTVAGLAALIERDRRGVGPTAPGSDIVADEGELHEPFALLLMQQAYRLGNDGAGDGVDMSTTCSFVMEYEDLSLPDFEIALNRLIRRHDMLRAVLEGESQQRILREVPHYTIGLRDLSGCDPVSRERELQQMRDALRAVRFPNGEWPSFFVGAARLDGNRHCLFFSFDMMFIDLFSARVLMRELELIYRREDRALPPIGISFRDYVTAMQAMGQGEAYARAKAYWLERCPGIPGPPQLPSGRRMPGGNGMQHRFRRRSFRLKAEQWSALRARADARRVSPTSVLLALYAATIGHWSHGEAFSLVVTLFNRLPLHRDVDKLVGDFTSSLIFAYEKGGAAEAAEIFSRVQAQLWRDLDHRQFGGVELQRELTRRRGGDRVLMPVVFTSALGLPAIRTGAHSLLAGRLAYSVTQTSNVWIDNQIEEDGDELVVNWDAADELFPAGLVDLMFDSYCRRLADLSTRTSAWSGTLDPMPPAIAVPGPAGDDEPFTPAVMYEDVLKVVERFPDRPAVITPTRTLTYGALVACAAGFAKILVGSGVAGGQRVGLLMDKEWDVPAAMLAVAFSGAAFVPIDPRWPDARREAVMAAAGIETVVTQPHLAGLVPGNCRSLTVPDAAPHGDGHIDPPLAARPGDIAYIMFTSGTTGMPKGVVMEHQSVVNTLRTVNRLFDVGADDRTLCVSSLCFDLSIYDIWGPLSCGGACVMLSEEDGTRPWRWPELIATHGVTLWNSVPALMELLLDASLGRESALDGLRLVLLSGDWIPLSMPDRIKGLIDGVEVISLGGATEAAIWSVYFPIGAIEDDWISIPYGKALPHQSLHVLDHTLRPCPVWATGDIYIGGVGLARGYWGDPDKTAAQFIRNPVSGERLYKTGDLGCYMPSGDIRFMGRQDGQIKLNGFRLELGEIEAALQAHPLVKNAIVQVGGARQLIAHIVLVAQDEAGYPDAASAADGSDEAARLIRCHLEERLPHYMVPATLRIVDALPVGANGKINRSALLDSASAEVGPERLKGSSDVIVEPVMAEIWQLMLDRPQPGKQDNFFACGGDSLIAMRFIAKVNSIFGLDLTARAIYDNPTLQLLAEHVEACRARRSEHAEPMPSARADQSARRFLPFPLTDLQRSYYIGRRDDIALGDVAAHSYVEIDYLGLDLARFEQAVNRLIRRHDMLRCVFSREGEQRFLEHTEPYRIATDEITGLPPDRQEAFLADKRRSLARTTYDLSVWPLFSLHATRHGHDKIRIHISLDIIIADAWSANIIARDLLGFYHGADGHIPALSFSFRDYVIYAAEFQKSARYRKMRQYWQRRLDTLPPPPDLPIRTTWDEGRDVTFTRYSATLCAAQWGRIKERSLAGGATPSSTLLAVFSQVLRLISAEPSFVINVTHFNRPPIHPEINDIVGDFASTFLLECPCRAEEPLDLAIGTMCRQILSDLDHSQYSGVRVLQDLSRRQGRVLLAPVVFTSALVLPVHSGVPLGTGDLQGEVVYALTQTPQVWLDHQVYQEQDALLLAWDVRDGMFDDGLIRILFDLYVATLEHLSDNPAAWHVPGSCVEPHLTAACRSYLDRVKSDPAYCHAGEGREHGSASSAGQALGDLLLAHPEVERVRVEHDPAAGMQVARVTLSGNALRYWDELAGPADRPDMAPLDRLELKLQAMTAEAPPPEGMAVCLPAPSAENRDVYFTRQSYRRFWGRSIDRSRLAQLLEQACRVDPSPVPSRPLRPDAILEWVSCLSALRVEHLPMPKYRYPSAGSCYSIRAYLAIPGSCDCAGLQAGLYELDPIGNSVLQRPDAGHAFLASGREPLVLLVNDPARIEPFYGARAQAFAELEAGAMIELLDQAARDLGLAIRPRPVETVFHPDGPGADLAVLAALSLSGSDDGPCSGESAAKRYSRLRARVYFNSAAGPRAASFAPDGLGGCIADEEDGIALDPLDRDGRQFLLELSADPDRSAGILADRLLFGGFCQRLMMEAPFHDLGLCMLGYVPEVMEKAGAGRARWYLAGGPLHPDQRRILQDDRRAQRELAARMLEEYVSDKGYERIQVEICDAYSIEEEDEGLGGSVRPEQDNLVDLAVRDIWKEVLKVPYLPRHANFFEMGGSSVEALVILRRLHDRYFIELKLHEVMARPTVDGMIGLIRGDARWSAMIHEVHAFFE